MRPNGGAALAFEAIDNGRVLARGPSGITWRAAARALAERPIALLRSPPATRLPLLPHVMRHPHINLQRMATGGARVVVSMATVGARRGTSRRRHLAANATV